MSAGTRVHIVSLQSPIAALVVRPAVTLGADATLASAAEAMVRERVAALLVDGVGLVTEHDVARAVARGVAGDEPVAAVGPAPTVIVCGRTPIIDACALMLNEDAADLVVDLGDRSAVVSLREVAAVLLQGADPHLWLASLRLAVDGPTEIWLG